jgi:DivIVA domain-containing protein
VRALRKLRGADAGARPLTAQDIRSRRFGQSPMAWRGFSEEEVITFLGRVAAVVETGEAEHRALRAEVARLRAFYRAQGDDVDQRALSPRPRPRPAPGDLPSHARQRLEAMTANAELYADLLTGGVHRPPTAPPVRDEARELLVHAEVSSRIGFEEVLEDFRAGYGDQPAASTAELRRTQLWLEEFTHALTAQLAALHTAVEDRLPEPDGLTAR